MAVDSVQVYLREIGRYPLLTAGQEIQLARQIEAGAALAGKAQLTTAEQRTLRMAERAKRKLMNCNLRLVVTIAKKYLHRLNGSGLEFMDLVQEGALGLTRAVELFDGSKGYKFSTYAYWWVRQAITRGIDAKERLIRVPQHGLDTVYKAVRFQRTYLQQHGRLPSVKQMADEVGADVGHLEMLLARNAFHRSLDELATETGSSIIELISDVDALDRQTDFVERDEKDAMLRIALHCLTESELHTVRRRFGMGGAEPMSLSAIASEDGVSRERVRQRLQAAHNKMRVRLNTARLI